MLYGLDIETAPRKDIEYTPWMQQNSDSLALYPQYSYITKIAVTSEQEELVFNSIEDFKSNFPWEGHTYVLQNFMFDLWHLHFHGVDIPVDLVEDDTKVIFHVLPHKIPTAWIKKYNEKREKINATLPKGVSHRLGSQLSLKCLAPYFLGVKPFWENPENHADDEYVLKDARYTLELRNIGYKLLEDAGCMDFYRFEMAAARMLYRMKLKGFLVDFKKVDDLSQEYASTLNQVQKDLLAFFSDADRAYKEEEKAKLELDYLEKENKAVSRLKNKELKEASTRARYKESIKKAKEKIDNKEFLLDSDKQLLWALKYYGYSCKNFKGKESTGKEALEKLLQSGHKEIKAILDYRKCQKRLTSYFPTYKALALKSTLHPDWNIASTRTGRLSSSGPNLQQVSPDLKPCFIARPGYKLISFDASAIEAKLIALYSNDPKLYEIVSQGYSIHDYRTKHVFFKELVPEILDCDINEIKSRFPKERGAAKTVGFARFYGSGWENLKASLQKAGFALTDEQAFSMWNLDREFFQVATNFHLAITDAFKQGAVIKNMFGRPVHIEKKGDCYMKGFNTLIQGSASDLNLLACLNAEQAYKDEGIDAYPIGLVHDEIIMEAKEEHAQRAADILVREMTAFELCNDLGRIPLTVEGGISDVWRK